LLNLFILTCTTAISQTAEQPVPTYRFGAGATVTNTGISLIPSFSLGKPAAMFDMMAGKGKLSFEPQLRFALTGKPWSFLFWWRYKLLKKDRFFVNIGAHPAFVFRTVPVTYNGTDRDMMVTDRYFATEVSPNYQLRKNITIGLYYIHSNSLDKGLTKNMHFITVNANFTEINLSKHYFMKFNPQAFYLKMDEQDGFYLSTTTTLARRDFPLSIQSIMSGPIETSIPSKSFLWNISLVYYIRHEYSKN
jgi:hypothetical protein